MNITSRPNSSTWLQEFTPYVNGQRVRWPDLALNLLAGDVCTLTLDYEYSWLIGDPDAHIVLEYQPGEGGQGLVFDPPLGQSAEMAEGTTSLSWTIKTTGAPSGSFVLQFAIPLFVEMPKSPPVSGAILNLAQELEVKFDEFPVSFGANAYPCHGAKHTFTVLPTPASQLLNKNIKLLMGGGDLGVQVKPSLANEQLLTPEGVTWELNCLSTTQNGDFSLQLMLVELGLRSSPLTMSLAHNLVTAERWVEQHEQWPEWTIWYSHHIRAKSVFSNALASGVQVTIESGSNTNYETTNSRGEAQVNNRGGLTIKMSILNRYDRTIV